MHHSGEPAAEPRRRKKPKRPHQWRLFFLGLPRRTFILPPELAPEISPTGVRMSALKGQCHDRLRELAYPYQRKMQLTIQMHKQMLSEERIEWIRKNIEASNATIYSKYANCYKDINKRDQMAKKKKAKAWTESDWKKHGAILEKLARPTKDFSKMQKPKKKKIKPLKDLLPRIQVLAVLPDFRCYRRLSQESTYRDPIKVSPGALTYQISDRVKKLAEPKASHEND